MKRLFRFLRGKIRHFNVISKISTRNLVRQKRRNILLGICIAVGMCILVVTTSFTKGLSDIIFNKMLIYMTGHIHVEATESTSVLTQVIRDEPRILNLVKENVEGIKRIDEAVGTMGRAIGNGKTGLLMPIGIKDDEEDIEDFVLEEGDMRDIFKEDIYPGIVLYRSTAKELNVKLNDVIYIKFQTIYNQPQSPSFKVVGIIRSENMFFDMIGFVDMKKLKEFLNMKPEEVLGLNIIVNYPEDVKKVIEQADKLYASLTPNIAGVQATLTARGTSVPADVFALKLKRDANAAVLAKEKLEFVAGSIDELEKDKHNIIISTTLAGELGLGVGDKLAYSYVPKYTADPVTKELVVAGVFKNSAPFKDATAFAHDGLFYETFYWNLPKQTASVSNDSPLYTALLSEWELLPRTSDTQSSMKKMQALSREKWDGTKYDVATMYELASQAVELQQGLNLISVIAVMVLFVVILIGIMNTMRMTIRERTREIGTNRAIGMQRKDVRSVFVYEILYLAILSCAVGIILGFGLIALISNIPVNLEDSPFSMFLVKDHFYFVPTFGAIMSSFGTIIFIAFIIAFFTARRAANMRAADALRHYE